MSLVVIALTKDELGNPWLRGHARLSELKIEEFFGRLRNQVPDANLTCRSYWKCAARLLLIGQRMAQKNKGLDPPFLPSMPALTNEEFYQCSVGAMKSALHLAASCSGVTVESLAKAYSEACSSGSLMAPSPGYEDDPDETTDDGPEDAAGKCQQVLGEITAVAAMDVEDNEDPDRLDAQKMRAGQFDLELGVLPDAAELREVVTAEESPDSADTEKPKAGPDDQLRPCTLHQALFSVPGMDLEMNDFVWDRLLRLSMSLRIWGGGCDQHWIRHARSARKASSKLSWYQCLVMF